MHKMTVRWTPKQVQQIEGFAKDHAQSFTDAVRTLVDIGLAHKDVAGETVLGLLGKIHSTQLAMRDRLAATGIEVTNLTSVLDAWPDAFRDLQFLAEHALIQGPRMASDMAELVLAARILLKAQPPQAATTFAAAHPKLIEQFNLQIAEERTAARAALTGD